MRKNKNTLCVWTRTGYVETSTLRTMLEIITSPVFLFGVSAVTVTVMIYFKLTQIWWMWVVASSTTGFAIMTMLLRRWSKGKLLISESQAKRHNDLYSAAIWLPNRYLSRIEIDAARALGDHTASRLLYRHLGEALVSLGLYDETGRTKIKCFSGAEFIRVKPVEFYTEFIQNVGIGYVLLMPSVNHIAKIDLVDERIISRVIRESGITGYTVERVSFDDDLVLFVLRDEIISRAYDFTAGE